MTHETMTQTGRAVAKASQGTSTTSKNAEISVIDMAYKIRIRVARQSQVEAHLTSIAEQPTKSNKSNLAARFVATLKRKTFRQKNDSQPGSCKTPPLSPRSRRRMINTTLTSSLRRTLMESPNAQSGRQDTVLV
ncbi:uncharacterized protein MONBRDRAFT_10259 [Monosiga brevicollis MX1]|uniref:Uncharacterized protein n=1 Tax=Monosiga brevicollis TaxID=81824 RepID=A9V5P4_MONBE|nr:uncharacterized protein MONBRDRAFT_10259 [Monosiga brevicollis MX1]EDQ87077.1 predicted protein [Monosiga brevicollis MX1]|eukprot:XP_001748020.1 hypothetical protein [Monosiga brevicollis MX1]